MLSKVRIGKHERGLWFRHKDFKGILRPGEYRFGVSCIAPSAIKFRS